MPIVSPIPQPGGSEVGKKRRYVRHQGSTDEIFCHPPVRFLFRFRSSRRSTGGPNHHLAAVARVSRVPRTDRRPLSRRRVLGTSSGFRTLASERQKNQNLDERAHAFRTGSCPRHLSASPCRRLGRGAPKVPAQEFPSQK